MLKTFFYAKVYINYQKKIYVKSKILFIIQFNVKYLIIIILSFLK